MRTKKIQAKNVHAGDIMLYGFKTARQKTYHVQEMHFDPDSRPPESTGIKLKDPGYVTLVLTQPRGGAPEMLYYTPTAPITVRIQGN